MFIQNEVRKTLENVPGGIHIYFLIINAQEATLMYFMGKHTVLLGLPLYFMALCVQLLQREWK